MEKLPTHEKINDASHYYKVTVQMILLIWHASVMANTLRGLYDSNCRSDSQPLHSEQLHKYICHKVVFIIPVKCAISQQIIKYTAVWSCRFSLCLCGAIIECVQHQLMGQCGSITASPYTQWAIKICHIIFDYNSSVS